MFFLRYQLLDAIGSGQYGQVYKGLCLQSQDMVAIKKLSLKSISTHHFIRELRTLSHARHPNLVNLIGVEYCGEVRYLILEYCNYGTMRTYMDASVSLEQKLQLIQDVLEGLSYLHERGICHCDLKPENILLLQGKDRLCAKIADLGSAIRRDIIANAQTLEDSTHLGSPAYMAPERFYGDVSPQADLYAMGVMLYELLLQKRPYVGQIQDLTRGHLSKAIEISDRLPFFLKSILEKSLQKSPRYRFQSAQEMLERVKLARLMLNSGQEEHGEQLFASESMEGWN